MPLLCFRDQSQKGGISRNVKNARKNDLRLPCPSGLPAATNYNVSSSEVQKLRHLPAPGDWVGVPGCRITVPGANSMSLLHCEITEMSHSEDAVGYPCARD